MSKRRTFLRSGDLRIKPLEPMDAQTVLENSEDAFFDIPKKNADECAKLFEAKNRDCFLLALWEISIMTKERQIVIGNLYFHGTQEMGSIEISLQIDPEYRDKKYGTRVLKIISDWAFCQKNVYEIHAYFDDQNSAAINAFTNAGYVYRENVSHVEHYSITKDPTSWRGLYVILGVWIGCIIAMLINHIIIGVVIGIFLGFALGFWLDNQELKRREEVTGVKQKRRKQSKDK